MKNQQRIAVKLSAIASGVILLALLAACGGGGSDGATPTPNGGGGNVPVVNPVDPAKPDNGGDGKVVDKTPPVPLKTSLSAVVDDPKNNPNTARVTIKFSEELDPDSTQVFNNGSLLTSGVSVVNDSVFVELDTKLGQYVPLSIVAFDISGNRGVSTVDVKIEQNSKPVWTPARTLNLKVCAIADTGTTQDIDALPQECYLRKGEAIFLPISDLPAANWNTDNSDQAKADKQKLVDMKAYLRFENFPDNNHPDPEDPRLTTGWNKYSVIDPLTQTRIPDYVAISSNTDFGGTTIFYTFKGEIRLKDPNNISPNGVLTPMCSSFTLHMLTKPQKLLDFNNNNNNCPG